MTDKYTYELVKESEYLPVRFLQSRFEPTTIPAHWHEDLELLYMQSGSMVAIIQARPYKLYPGDLLIVNSKEIHMTRTTTSSHYLLLQIPFAFMHQYVPNFEQVRFQTLIQQNQTSNQVTKIPEIFEQLFQTYFSDAKGHQLLFSSHLHLLLHYLYQHHSTNIAAYGNTSNRDFNRITSLMNWVNQNFQSPLTLDNAANELSLSKEYLCRLFKKYTGQTFLEYLYTIRTMNVYKAIRKSDTSFTLLLEENGITNYKIFMRTFKKLYNDTPRNIRKQFHHKI